MFLNSALFCEEFNGIYCYVFFSFFRLILFSLWVRSRLLVVLLESKTFYVLSLDWSQCWTWKERIRMRLSTNPADISPREMQLRRLLVCSDRINRKSRPRMSKWGIFENQSRAKCSDNCFLRLFLVVLLQWSALLAYIYELK